MAYDIGRIVIRNLYWALLCGNTYDRWVVYKILSPNDGSLVITLRKKFGDYWSDWRFCLVPNK
jgi:hypothetical protein